MAYVGWSTTESYSSIQDQITLYGMLTGAGAAAPVVSSTVVSRTSSKSFMQQSTNMLSTVAADTTRSGAGVYTTKLRSSTPGVPLPSGIPPIVIDVTPNVWGPNGTWATIVDFNPSTGVLSFNTFAPGGTAADLAATESIHFTFTCQNTTPFK